MVPKNPATRARINRNGSDSSGSYPVTPGHLSIQIQPYTIVHGVLVRIPACHVGEADSILYRSFFFFFSGNVVSPF